jgi:transposase
MWHCGIDYHKRYSTACVIDEAGQIVREERLGHEDGGRMIERFFEGMKEPCEVVFEAGQNWMWLYEVVEPMRMVSGIHVASPYQTRLIAAAQIKTDKMDARKLAQLLRAKLIPEVHIPGVATRAHKLVLRQRMFLVRQRTRVRNRIHKVLARQHHLEMPVVSDLFGAKGRAALQAARIGEPDRHLLDDALAVLATLDERIKREERLIKEPMATNGSLRYVESMPGMGPILGGVVVTEIDEIERFRDADKLSAYAGLVPSTYSSGGKTTHGRTLSACNKWLKWALIEGAWVAVGHSAYFGAFYRRQLGRGKTKTKSIVIVARRMCHIIWQMLHEQRPYEERVLHETFPGRSASTLTNAA